MRRCIVLARLSGFAAHVKRRNGDACTVLGLPGTKVSDSDQSEALKEHCKKRQDRKDIARRRVSAMRHAPPDQIPHLPCLEPESSKPAHKTDSGFPRRGYSSKLLLVSRERAAQKSLTGVSLLQHWPNRRIVTPRPWTLLAKQSGPPARKSQKHVPMQILLIEDEPEMALLIRALAEQAGFSLDHGRSLEDAREAARRSDYDLVLLDRRLPDGDGLSLLPALRAMRPGIRVMMLTALDTLDDTVSGLDAGADDYLAKPFRGPELISRIRACLRRPGCEAQPALAVADIRFEFTTRQVFVSGKPVGLHRRELMLLEALMRRLNRVAAREVLLDEVYGRDAEVQQHTLDTLVWRLRRRLDALGAGVTIHLARGIGYMLTESTR
jgi:two-component system, OmpR family, response regulator